ncbi:ImpA family metalloprotease [Plesiomonas sp.]|uniref:ImpA family metalloprotease n=1 Tax=Plesiomonas sp. TaxID=2486279 RepID=UPI003F3A95C2
MKKIAISSLICLSLFGCGGDESDSYTPPPSTEPPPTEPIPETYFSISAESTEGGKLSPKQQKVVAGKSGKVTVQPDTDFTLASISGCDGVLNGNTYTTNAVNANCTINATFAKEKPEVKYTVSASVTGKGAVTPTSQQVNEGSRGILKIKPDNGFLLEKIEGCGGKLAERIYTTAPITADCEVKASFISNVEFAIAMEDHQYATAKEFITYASDLIDTAALWKSNVTPSFYEGITRISWDPSHDSIFFTPFAVDSTLTLLPSNINGSGEKDVRGLVMLSEQDSYRQAAMGANLFSVNRNTETDTVLQNLLQWLTRSSSRSDQLNIITAHMPSSNDHSSFFPHNENIRKWLNEFYPDNHTINQPYACDYSALEVCIDTMQPSLIIISDFDPETKGHNAIAPALEKAKKIGIPVLLSNYSRDPSPLLAPQYVNMGLSAFGNHWSKLQSKDQDVSTILAEDNVHKVLKKLLVNLDNGYFDNGWMSECDKNIRDCNSGDTFNAEFKYGANLLRDMASLLDANRVSAFSRKYIRFLSAVLLLADKYRIGIDYPLEFDEHQAWQRAIIADMVINYARTKNLAQPDLGEYVIDRENVIKGNNAHYTYPATITESKRISVPYTNQWTTTGWYALPGQQITLTRTDTSDAFVTVKLNYHRAGTNKALEHKKYLAPIELATERLPLGKNGSVTFTSPYGGSIYLTLSGSQAPLQVEVTATGIVKHPTITNFNDDAQITEFENTLAKTELPHIDLRSDVTEQHMRRDRFTGAIDPSTAISDTKSLLKSIIRDHIETVYTLAGFKVPQKTLSESLPVDVSTACINLFGNKCIDESLHTRTIIQHSNYDQNANCGVACSGNPWDSSYNITPTGWGDNHELGHNLQTPYLNINYAAESDSDNWPGYSNRAGEASNNIFAYYALWRAHYIRDQSTETITDGHTNIKDLFYAFMSDAAKVTNSNGERVVLYPDCSITGEGHDRYEATWKGGSNQYSFSFYIQMALRADKMKLADSTMLNNGFNIFTLLYQHSRIFSKFSDTEENWNANRDRLGFSDFPFSGHSVYGDRRVADMPGNDFMLVSLSKLTGYNWRTYFDMYGLRYSSLAAEQAQKNQTKGDLEMGMYVLENDLPPRNMSEGLTFLPLSLTDGSTLWPRDNSSPIQCQVN